MSFSLFSICFQKRRLWGIMCYIIIISSPPLFLLKHETRFFFIVLLSFISYCTLALPLFAFSLKNGNRRTKNHFCFCYCQCLLLIFCFLLVSKADVEKRKIFCSYIFIDTISCFPPFRKQRQN